MPLPKKVKKDINVYPSKTLLERREQMLEEITNQDTNLPESVMHEDLDLGMLEFVKEHLRFKSDGKYVNFIEKILSLQRWAELSNTFDFINKDEKMQLPFITVVRKPEVPYGSNPALQYTIPDRQSFFYRRISTWDGNRLGADVYKIPQPIPVDISFDVVVVCNRMRELNGFNTKVMQKFSSRQSYTVVKGHYIPLVLESISDQSQIDSIEGRRFYQQVYSFQMQGFLIDDEEFEIVPAINRELIMMELGADVKGNSSVNTFKTIKHNVEINAEVFTGDSVTTTFKVQRKVNNLFFVELNGIILVQGEDYFHNGNSSNIIFSTPPPLDSKIRISYSFDNNFVDIDGSRLSLSKDIIEFEDGVYEYDLSKPIHDIILVDVGGMIQLENDYYTFNIDNKKLTVNEIPPLSTPPVKMSVVYLTKS